MFDRSLKSPFSKKMSAKIENPRNVGFFKEEDARESKLFISQKGSFEKGEFIKLYFLINSEDGVVVDAKFQAFGPPSLIAILDATLDLSIGKNLTQVKKIQEELILKELLDKNSTFSEKFPTDLFLCLKEIATFAEEAGILPKTISPLHETPLSEFDLPKWDLLSYSEKLILIEKVLEEEVRPYIALDEGGVTVKELVNETELHISYQGACTSCFSSIGATLSTIQSILQSKIHPDLKVIPDMEGLLL